MHRPALGVSDFKEIVQKNAITAQKPIYFDKTLMIKDIAEDDSKFLLFARPRRFGKTLNMSMLKYFFGSQEDIFSDLKISEYPEILEKYRGKVPTIFLSLKDVKGGTLSEMLEMLAGALQDCLFMHKIEELGPELDLLKRQKCFSNKELVETLRILSRRLYTYYDAPVLILLDEYDTPLNNAYAKKYLDEALDIFRQFFSQTFKDNPYLYKGIITGINRIARENIFSGLNNVEIYDINATGYSNYFGFTEDEIDSLGLPDQKRKEVRDWYNGYNFGGTTIYNPWSILNYIKKNYIIAPYWSNTGGMTMIQESLSPTYASTMEKILDGEEILVEMEDSLVFAWLKDNEVAFLNLLYSAGYLTASHKQTQISEDFDKKYLKVPNREVQNFLKKLVLNWFSNHKGGSYVEEIVKYFVEGDAATLQEYLSEIILNIFSFNDVTRRKQENFYHGFMLGLSLAARERYTIKSNRESGYGRYDIAWYPKNIDHRSGLGDPGILIELKIDASSAEEALKQIDTKKYESDLLQHGCETIMRYGIHCNGKEISVVGGYGGAE